MIVAIDYDNTYTLDPESWNNFILAFQSAGHTIICVTNRNNSENFVLPVMNSIGKLCPIVFAGSQWKQEAALKQGYKVDVWIDDTPAMITPQLLIGDK